MSAPAPTPAPAGLRTWTPSPRQLARFSAPSVLVWKPHTTLTARSRWVDGFWENPDEPSRSVLGCDLAVADDCCRECLTDVEQAYGRLHHAETGGYLALHAGGTHPVLVLPGERITLEHALAALRHFATALGRDAVTAHAQLPL